MKKIWLLHMIILTLLLNGCMDNKVNQKSETGNMEKLTLIEAVELAYSDAVKWNQGAQLINAGSVDSENGVAGIDGKARRWDITFGIPETEGAFLVNIEDAKIAGHADITDEGAPPVSEDYFITDPSDMKFDSPELLKKAINTEKLYPSEDWQREYSFGLIKDAENGIILIEIIGWDKEEGKWRELQFNANTGELSEDTERIKKTGSSL